jgi:hypothetical protein
MSYTAFKPHRSIRQYLGTPGPEVNGLALPYYVLDSHANCVSKDLPDEFIVTGETTNGDKTFLQFGVTRDYIEAVSDFREVNGQLIYVCPDCQGHSGKHSRSCKRG